MGWARAASPNAEPNVRAYGKPVCDTIEMLLRTVDLDSLPAADEREPSMIPNIIY
jgi:hypothetical protein